MGSKNGREEENMRILRVRKNGQSLVEYGLVLALIAIVAILVVKAVGTKTTSTFDNVQSQMTAQGIASTAPTAASS
jgi:Flp pilus assembly pilin Flp